MFEAPVRGELQLEIERFLYAEARLLDDRRFNDWLSLFADDATYSLQVREVTQRQDAENETRVELSPPLFEDDRRFLEMRIRRLETRLAHAEQPPSLTRRLIGNILVENRSGDREITVYSNFIVFQTRSDLSEHLLLGSREDRLRQEAGGWKIACRRVFMDRPTLPRTITIFF